MPLLDVNNFSGGINNSNSEYLIQKNEAVDLLNCDVEDGSLRPVQDRSKASNPLIDELTHQNGDRSLVTFRGDTYWSDNETSELSSSLGYIGISPPETAIKAEPIGNSDRFDGVFQYLFRWSNGEGVRSAAFLPGRKQFSTAVVNTTKTVTVTLGTQDFPDFQSQWILTTRTIGPGASQGFNERIADFDRTGIFFNFMPYPVGSRVNHSGNSWKLLRNFGNVEGDVIDVTGTNDRVVLTLQEPSRSSPAWELITSSTEQTTGSELIKLSNFPRPTESQALFIDIYRTAKNGSDFYFLDEIDANATSYEDRTIDAHLTSNELLLEASAFPPIYQMDGNTWTRIGGKYLTELNGRYWLAIGDRLFHSLAGDIHSWNPSHVVEMKGEITGINDFDDSLIVWLKDQNPRIVTGNVENGTLAITTLASTQTNPNWRTTTKVFNSTVWQSKDGICTIEKRPLGEAPLIRVVTEGRYEFDDIGRFALGHKGKYYLFQEDHVVIFDFIRNRITRTGITAKYGYSARDEDKLFIVDFNEIFRIDGGSTLDLQYTSPVWFMDSVNTKKVFKSLYLNTDSAVNYTVWYDNKDLVVNNKSTSNNLVSLPHKYSNSIQVKLTSSDRIKGYQIEYEEVF